MNRLCDYLAANGPVSTHPFFICLHVVANSRNVKKWTSGSGVIKSGN